MSTVTTRIVGASHYPGAQTKLNVLRAGVAIELRREPDNGDDLNAIACWKDGQMLGYVPRKDNAQPAAAMDRGEPVTARIMGHQPGIQLSWPSIMRLDEATKLRG